MAAPSMQPSRPYLGVGVAFPLRPTATGGLAWSSGEQDIREAIWIVLGTAPGERPMLPDFGCGIHGAVFSPNTPVARGDMAHHVRAALTRWEPRIDVLDVRVDGDPGDEARMLIRIDYRVRANNASHNLVYPFYVTEGSGG